MKDLKLLIKFPTRARKDKFFSVLDKYYNLLTTDNVYFLISCDTDDIEMNNEDVKKRLEKYKNLRVEFKDNKSKVEAINSGLAGEEFDILLLASDDMIPEYKGYDSAIKKVMNTYFPDLDGVIWTSDGFQKANLNTLCILGKKYYDRFRYIYHPDYKSLYCDQEFTAVSIALKKVVYVDNVLIRHQQYSIIKEQPDELYIRNDNLQYKDRKTFEERQARNFDL